MAIEKGTVTATLEGIGTKTIGSSTLSGNTYFEEVLRFTNGTGASQSTSVVDGLLNNNNTAVQLTTFQNTTGDYISAETKLRGIALKNNGAASTTISSSISGFPGCVLAPGGWVVYSNPAASPLTCSYLSTITSNGTAGQYTRVILFLS